MWDGAGSIFALGMRITKLDITGAPLVGAGNCYKTNALVKVGLGLEYREGAEIEQVGGTGEICLYYKVPDQVKRGTISDFQVCTPDPNINQFLLGGDIITITGTAEVQTITITGTPTGGTFTLTFDGQTTAGIAFNAAAAAVQSALEALSNLAPGDVTVTGAAGGPYTATFTAAEGDIPQMTASGAGLTGGTAPAVVIATTTPGNNLTDIGYRAPQVGVDPTPFGVSLEFWSGAIVDGAYSATYPYTHWVVGRGFVKLAENFALTAESAALPSYEGWCNQNANWGDGPIGDWPYQADRVWQYARVTTLPDLTPGLVAVA